MARVIYIEERKNLIMLKKDIIRRNPLRLMGYENDDILKAGGFGAVLARAGVGKTAFMVQLALDKLLRDKNVLHVSLSEPVEKVCLWYEEVFKNIAFQCNIKKLDHFWEAILPNRFIMTFKVDGFSVPKLAERISDVTEQGIFMPQMVLIDGLSFELWERDTMLQLKQFAKEQNMAVWFTVRTHRDEKAGSKGLPLFLENLADLYEVIFELQPDGKEIHVKALKGGPDESLYRSLVLEPSTMLITDKNINKEAIRV